MALAFNIFILIMGRFIVGMGIGFAAMIVPVYLAEVSPKELRGIVVSTNILFCTSGQLIAYLICLLFGNN